MTRRNTVHVQLSIRDGLVFVRCMIGNVETTWSSLWLSCSRLVIQKIPQLSWDPKVHYYIHERANIMKSVNT
jgi:hypothetical protein